MNPTKQRIAIASLVPGWLAIESGELVLWDQNLMQIESDPLTDLNAMHEALSVISKQDLGREFMRQLDGVLNRRHEAYEHASGEPVITSYFLLSSEARDWAEAFLRTLGKWEEGE